jgi:hypothetical protein
MRSRALIFGRASKKEKLQRDRGHRDSTVLCLLYDDLMRVSVHASRNRNGRTCLWPCRYASATYAKQTCFSILVFRFSLRSMLQSASMKGLSDKSIVKRYRTCHVSASTLLILYVVVFFCLTVQRQRCKYRLLQRSFPSLLSITA